MVNALVTPKHGPKEVIMTLHLALKFSAIFFKSHSRYCFSKNLSNIRGANKTELPKHIIHIHFDNRRLESVHLNSILHEMISQIICQTS